MVSVPQIPCFAVFLNPKLHRKKLLVFQVGAKFIESLFINLKYFKYKIQ
jgi:hypothetical protein